MKKNIHPNTRINKFTCSSCNSLFNILTTNEKESINIDICSNCHPFYLGKTNLTQTTTRSEKLKSKFAKGIKVITEKTVKKTPKVKVHKKQTDISDLL